MSSIKFLPFTGINPLDLMAVMNEDSLRLHLIDHPYFDIETIDSWICEKIETDQIQGCRVRVVLIDQKIAGWCGIQPESEGFEIAIVISQRYWGAGIAIFKTLVGWGRELGHNKLVFNLLESRREYKALRKIASKIECRQLLGRSFTTYHLPVIQSGA